MQSQNKVLVLDTCHPVLIEKLTNHGFQVEYRPTISFEDFLKIAPAYSGLILRSRFKLTREILQSLPDLKFIGRIGSGMESIDTEAAHEYNIRCFNSPEGNRDALAEHALGMLLMLLNHLYTANREVKAGQWNREKNRGTEIKGKTIGIIGYGNMGSAFAKRLNGFDARVLAYDKYKKRFSDDYVKECSLDEIFKETDILSLHVPLTSETQEMIDLNFINSFSKPIYLINTARGKIVHTPDLVKALQQEKVLGAALDVLEYEDHSFEQLATNSSSPALTYLRNADNVILSPHIAGWSVESLFKLADILAEKIIRHITL